MGVQIPAGGSKWTAAFQTRQFDTQIDNTALNPWLSQTEGWISDPTSAGAGDIGNADGDTAGEGNVFTYLANPPAAGVTASATPSQVFSQNTDPTVGTTNYPYNTTVDDYIEGDLGYDNPPES